MWVGIKLLSCTPTANVTKLLNWQAQRSSLDHDSVTPRGVCKLEVALKDISIGPKLQASKASRKVYVNKD